MVRVGVSQCLKGGGGVNDHNTRLEHSKSCCKGYEDGRVREISYSVCERSLFALWYRACALSDKLQRITGKVWACKQFLQYHWNILVKLTFEILCFYRNHLGIGLSILTCRLYVQWKPLAATIIRSLPYFSSWLEPGNFLWLKMWS